MGTLVMVGQMLLALTLLIAIHEWGHFAAARLFKIKVDKFFVFMDIPFGKRSEEEIAAGKSKYAWDGKLFKTKKGDTEYGFGWLPLGGYVKINGMIDESRDMEHLNHEPQPYEFRSKPAWQKLIVMLAGIIMNVITAIVIFTGINYFTKKVYRLQDVGDKAIISDYGKSLGLQQGDIILGANGKRLERRQDILYKTAFGGELNVERAGKEVVIQIPENFYREKKSLFTLPSHVGIEELTEGENAAKAGLQQNDIFKAINGQQISSFSQFVSQLANYKSQTAEFTILRDGQEILKEIPVSSEGKLGFRPFEKVRDDLPSSRFSFMESVKYGVSDSFNQIFLTLKAMGQVKKGKANAGEMFSGPIGIAKQFGTVWNWQRFWLLTGMISMGLAFMNLLPIPVLDGGHAVFAIIEMITGKPVNEKIVTIASNIGFFIVITLMILIYGNDIVRAVLGK